MSGADAMYGVMNVRLVESGGDEQITERRFVLTNTEEKRSRELVHFQYTEWPDWGYPANCDAFLRLVDSVDEHNVSGGPSKRTMRLRCVLTHTVIVHCSAGIGRTGTFCTVHAALEKFRAERAGCFLFFFYIIILTFSRSLDGGTKSVGTTRVLRASTGGFAELQPTAVLSGDDEPNELAAEETASPATRAVFEVRAVCAHLQLMGLSPTQSRDGSRPGHVSIVRIITHLRRARPGMVQTRDQMQFTYKAILTAFERELNEPLRVTTLRGAAKRLPPIKTRATFLDQWRGDAALYFDPSTSHTRAGVTWSRIASAAVVLPSNDHRPTPIVSQGALGDAWFLGAVLTVATKPGLLADRLRMQYDAAKGEFRCRFFKDGCWRSVLVDDRVPCFAQSSVPVFVATTAAADNFLPLLEKAYAKLHGCYQALEGGTLLQGMVDLTGGAPERYAARAPAASCADSRRQGGHCARRRLGRVVGAPADVRGVRLAAGICAHTQQRCRRWHGRFVARQPRLPVCAHGNRQKRRSRGDFARSMATRRRR